MDVHPGGLLRAGVVLACVGVLSACEGVVDQEGLKRAAWAILVILALLHAAYGLVWLALTFASVKLLRKGLRNGSRVSCALGACVGAVGAIEAVLPPLLWDFPIFDWRKGQMPLPGAAMACASVALFLAGGIGIGIVGARTPRRR
ncbi:MAG: hypothetical protein IPF92_21315 [Myxococcales bacterium]|nr:hypothetical protein [Myxococcales bacterium]